MGILHSVSPLHSILLDGQATPLTCFGGIFCLLSANDGSGTQEPTPFAWWDNLPSLGGFRHTLNNSDQEILKSHKI